jgi:hypothetical protein
MVMKDELKSKIESSRKVSQDRSLVTYDLTEGVDFSDPRAVAEALSEVFFENDALKWFKINDDQVDFEPTYKVRVILAEEHHKLIENTVDDFLKDLQKEDVSRDFSKQINDDANSASRLQSVMAVSAIKSTFFHHSIEKVYADSIKDDLFVDLLEKLEIRSLNNEDLMDWKKLPL